MTADPLSTGYAALYSVLSADSTLMGLLTGIYQVMAPPSATPDYCLMSAQAAPDTLSATGSRVLTRAVFQVKAVGPQSDAATLRAAFARLDGLLQPGGEPLRNSNGTLAIYRQSALQVGELVNGELWLNIGGLYRVEVSA